MYLSHNINNSLIELEVAVNRIVDLDLNEENLLNMTNERNSQFIFYLLNDIGINVQLKESGKLLEGKKLVTKDFRGKLAENFKNTLDLSKEIASDEQTSISTQILLEINKSIGIETCEDWKLNYRAGGENFSLVYENLASCINPTTQLPDRSSDSYASIVTMILGSIKEDQSLNRFYKISQCIYDLISVHPFIIYNRFTIIYFAHTLFSRETGHQNNFINFAELFTQNINQMISIFEINEEEEKIIAWHEFFIEFCKKQYIKNTREIITSTKSNAQNKYSKNETEKPFLDLNRRQIKILKYLQTIPTVKREDYVHMTDVSTMTAYRDLQELVKNRLLRPIGTGRGTKYTLASR